MSDLAALIRFRFIVEHLPQVELGSLRDCSEESTSIALDLLKELQNKRMQEK